MEISNPDLINSCRVCRNPNQDGDYECLYGAATTSGEMLPALSHAGKLYEELFGALSPGTYEHYPRYLCNSCDLQMRLFKKLKDKAVKTMEYLSKISITKEPQQLDDGEADFLDVEQMDETPLIAEEHVEDRRECYSETENNTHDDVQSVLELEPILENASLEDRQQYSDLDFALNDPVFADEHTEVPTEYDQLQYNSIEQALELPIQKQENIEEAQYPLESVIPQNDDIVMPEDDDDDEHSAVIDKSDYVLEIYELLEDGSKTMHSEFLVEDEEENDGDMDDFDIEEGTESQLGFDDEQYIDDELLGLEGSADEFKHPGQRRANKRKLQIDDKKREYKCTECSVIFTSTKEFKYHREYVHTQVYKCHICSKTFKSAYSLPTHMKIHESPEFQCEICQRTFTQKAHFQYHMNRHNNIRNFKCEECGKAFIGKTDLKFHMRQHTGDRPYVCEICGKDYMYSEHLKSHALKHTGQQFPCDLCGQNFATPKTLRQHKQTIHVDAAKFKCPFCTKPFRRRHHLQYHMKQLHPSTDILTESLYDIIDDSEKINNDFNAEEEEADVNVDDDLIEHEDFTQDPGYVALNDDTILM